jgi:hypothetical protein
VSQLLGVPFSCQPSRLQPKQQRCPTTAMVLLAAALLAAAARQLAGPHWYLLRDRTTSLATAAAAVAHSQAEVTSHLLLGALTEVAQLPGVRPATTANL